MSYGPEKLIPAQDLKECAMCSRYFAPDRISTHEAICQTSSTIKRKSFNISHQRTRGTEAEKLANTSAQNECLTTVSKNGPYGLSTNWRWKHEDFLKKIKDCKNRANEKNKKVSDLPFPPPVDSETKYVQCEHCSRQFNEGSALRHIATCANTACNLKRNFTGD